MTLPATNLTSLIKYKDIKSRITTSLNLTVPSEIPSHSIISSSRVRNVLAI